ncbi:WYL domain-containing protein [Rhodococcus sp. BP-252]|uniref:helix-turn-helix transcriptional regulator n=1 Tax=unclassified Rhodococcus (in: high G+C Gram-positive bacteria) TaxID=192944 RepID=UPI001C9B6643|nr:MULTISPECIES: WYL domain-containing protein [unclassified Rhodococcus (in: high G+C Gram-positive bacteria)]MBY6412568.1 WYL domain-containing protein [Rhodococcus sp. BP-320]MBY6417177.1 WYL domain-containing protein [Rhodococcus sp. BP-321]MBY6424548.1 WYL domain-containing protein [Rhodococcus sp. BP-324]MBY6427201.1 WYL domain-containing protein [Rhodococcus sp. BP-323]MBY6432186.1 WYL domain-containing protein [Rhodococcus sp. BP-322]
MRSSRLLQLMLTLQHGRATTAQALADEAGVSVRTIYRDIAALGAAGVPLWTESGPGGGVRLLDGWQSKLTGMTGVETSALMLLGVPSIAADLGLSDATAAAENKLLGALPMPLRAGAQVWRERLYVDAPGWFTEPAANEHLPTISTAVLTGRPIELGYRGSTRRVDPLGLVAKAGVWYLVARRESTVLSYRVDRTSSVELRDGQVERPDGFHLATWWAESTAKFDRALLKFDCRVRLSPAAVHMLRGVIGREATPDPMPARGADGWTTTDLRLETFDVALSQVTALGVGVEVLAPARLRRALRAVALEMADRNA